MDFKDEHLTIDSVEAMVFYFHQGMDDWSVNGQQDQAVIR
jgi:hypothetical protein